jgi:hypothetical protein
MSLADRLDPDVRAALKPYFDFFGPGGMNAIADISERRARYAELLAAAKAAQPPNPRVSTTDVLRRTRPRLRPAGPSPDLHRRR